jgi:hypothetical protein
VSPESSTTIEPGVALPAAAPASRSHSSVPVGVFALVVVLAGLLGAAACAAFVMWRRQRSGMWWN